MPDKSALALSYGGKEMSGGAQIFDTSTITEFMMKHAEKVAALDAKKKAHETNLVKARNLVNQKLPKAEWDQVVSQDLMPRWEAYQKDLLDNPDMTLAQIAEKRIVKKKK